MRGAGRGGALWLRAPNGGERRLTRATRPSGRRRCRPTARASPTSARRARRRLHVRSFVAGCAGAAGDSVVVDRPCSPATAERLAWSPAGDRLAFAGTCGQHARRVRHAARRPLHEPRERASRRGRLDARRPHDRARRAWRRIAPATTATPIGCVIPASRRAAARRRPDGQRPLDGRCAGRGRRALAERHVALDAARGPSATPTRSIALESHRSALLRGARCTRAARAWEALRRTPAPRALAAHDDDELDAVIHDLLREHPPFRQAATGRAAVSSAHPVATAAGLEILREGRQRRRRGGRGVVRARRRRARRERRRAAMARCSCYQKGMDAARSSSSSCRACPKTRARRHARCSQNGRYPDDGPVLANVPGTVAAMHPAWQKYGSRKLAWADLARSRRFAPRATATS